jgi:large repetitive protein
MWARRLSVLVALALIAHGASALDKSGLVLHLTFDEGAGTVAGDASGAGNDGALVGNVAWVAGKIGGAVSISDDAGENMIVVANDASLNPESEITLAAWALVENMPDDNNSLITKADTWMIHTSNWRGEDGSIDWEPLLWTPGFVAWQTTSSAVVPLGEWHHFAGVYDGTGIVTYIDGQEAGTFEQAGPLATSDVDVVIGRDSRSCCADRKAQHTIDEAMIWSRALSANEVAEIMSGVTPVEPRAKLATVWGSIKTR